MERDDLRQVMERLEAIAALSTLFKNLWYERIRDEVENEKVRAYLTVYEDAVPYLNQVLEFAHHSASLLADGKLDQDKYERLQLAFGQLGAALLGREVDEGMEMPGLEDLESAVEFTPEQEAEMEGDLFEAEDLLTVPGGGRDAGDDLRLEGVSQAEVEALLADPHNGTTTNIDSLFDSGDPASAASSQEEIDALLEEPERAGEADELDDLLQDEALAEAETSEADAIGEADVAAGAEDGATDEDLSDLLDTAGEDGDEMEELLDLGDLESAEEEPAEAPAEETELDLGELDLEEDAGSAEELLDLEVEATAEDGELDLSDLELGEEKSDEGELDLGDLLGEDDHSEAEVSDDDLNALLNGEEDEVEEEIQTPKPALRPAAPTPKAAAKPAPKAEPTPKAAAPAPKAAAKPAPRPATAPKPAAPAPKAAAKPAPKSAPAKDNKAEDDSISQDEIDALFG